MTSRLSNLQRRLKPLAIPIALSLAATLFSGNTINLLNDWDWFNGSFNTTTYLKEGNPESVPSAQIDDSEAVVMPPIAIQVEPIITVNPANVNVWQQFAPGDAPDLNQQNVIEFQPSIQNFIPIDITLPDIDIDQWMQPQSYNLEGSDWQFSQSWLFQGTSASQIVTRFATNNQVSFFDQDWLIASYSSKLDSRRSPQVWDIDSLNAADENNVATLDSSPSQTVDPRTLTPHDERVAVFQQSPSPSTVAIVEPPMALGLGIVGVALLLQHIRTAYFSQH